MVAYLASRVESPELVKHFAEQVMPGCSGGMGRGLPHLSPADVERKIPHKRGATRWNSVAA
jgi:hypothetical protein